MVVSIVQVELVQKEKLEKYIVLVVYISTEKRKKHKDYNQYYTPVIELGIIVYDESGKNICNVYISLVR